MWLWCNSISCNITATERRLQLHADSNMTQDNKTCRYTFMYRKKKLKIRRKSNQLCMVHSSCIRTMWNWTESDLYNNTAVMNKADKARQLINKWEISIDTSQIKLYISTTDASSWWLIQHARTHTHTHTHTHNLDVVWDNPGKPVPIETFTHSHSSWWIILYLHPPSNVIHGNLSVQFTRLTVFSHNLSPSFLWFNSWSRTLRFIFHIFLQPIIVFFLQHMPIPLQPVLL